MTDGVWQDRPHLWPGSTSDRGAPQVGLCLHGLGGGVYEFQFLAEFLANQGMAVQTLLYPGHGPPPQPMPPSTWQQWVDHSLQVLQTLQPRYPRIILIGFSTGAPLALHLSLLHPVDGLILIAPFMRLHRIPALLFPLELYLNTVGRLIRHLPRHQLAIRDPEMQALSRSAPFSQTFRLQVVRSALQMIAAIRPQLAQIQLPTLILQSPLDSVVDPQGAVWLHRRLGSAVKRLVWLERSDHNLLLDLEREDCFSLIWAFLQEQGLASLPR